MTAGVPGLALSGLFYLLLCLAMPAVEAVRTLRGQSSGGRWRLVARHVCLATAMVAGIDVAFRTLGLLVPVRAAAPAAPRLAAVADAVPFVGSVAFLATLATLTLALTAVELVRLAVRRASPPGAAES